MILKPRDPNRTVIFKISGSESGCVFIITIRCTALTRSKIKYIFLVRILDEGDEAVDEDDGQLQQDEEWKQYSVDISLLDVVGLICERFCPPPLLIPAIKKITLARIRPKKMALQINNILINFSLIEKKCFFNTQMAFYPPNFLPVPLPLLNAHSRLLDIEGLIL